MVEDPFMDWHSNSFPKYDSIACLTASLPAVDKVHNLEYFWITMSGWRRLSERDEIEGTGKFAGCTIIPEGRARNNYV